MTKKKKTPKRKPAAKQRGTGRPFKKGQSGNPAGRPKGINYREAVEAYAAEHGIDLREAIGKVTMALIEAAEKHDVPAAKLVFDRLCGVQPREPGIEVNVDVKTTNVTGPRGGDWVGYARKLVKVSEDLSKNGRK